jgi:hypothetical protein
MRAVHARRISSGDDAKIRDKIRNTRIAKGDWSSRDQNSWDEYRKIVRRCTNDNDLSSLPNIEKRGRGPGKYHLDHIVSQKTGYDLGLPPYLIGHISNLRMIPESDNCSKQDKSDEDDIIHLWFSLTEVFDYALDAS